MVILEKKYKAREDRKKQRTSPLFNSNLEKEKTSVKVGSRQQERREKS